MWSTISNGFKGKKWPWIFIELIHLSTMVINYQLHISKHIKDKKQMM
jgi:hypothetical protein